jgi:hypothetical protein
MVDKRLVAGAAVLIVLALGAGGIVWWKQRGATPAATPAPEAAVTPAPAPVPVPVPPAPAEAPIRHPIAAAEPEEAPGAVASLDRAALVDLFGQKAVFALLQIDGFVPRLVATVDNLDRPHAAPRLWPVHPTAGRFGIERNGEVEQIAAANAQRYRPFVQFAEGIDSPRAVALYKRHYAIFQQAYGDLGYPRAYFNDRLVEVIDHLLATPEPAATPALRLTEVKGPQPLTQPWLHYEYADPGLEALSSGQKMLVRMGPENARRLKAKLAEFRRLIASGPPR